jgi:hypothetical protein
MQDCVFQSYFRLWLYHIQGLCISDRVVFQMGKCVIHMQESVFKSVIFFSKSECVSDIGFYLCVQVCVFDIGFSVNFAFPSVF